MSSSSNQMSDGDLERFVKKHQEWLRQHQSAFPDPQMPGTIPVPDRLGRAPAPTPKAAPKVPPQAPKRPARAPEPEPEEPLEYQVIRSDRKSSVIQISQTGEITVRAPYHTTDAEVEKIVRSHWDWIEKTLQAIEEQSEGPRPLRADEYSIKRSDRKSISLQVTEHGIIVKAPWQMTDAEIGAFVIKHKDWIEKQIQKVEEERRAAAQIPKLTFEELQELGHQASLVIPERVRYYAPKIGVTYGRITIRNQRSRWGSCSSKGNLNFNCLLMLAPPEVLDSVVVHELCHRKEMNHSDAFYAEVLRVFPDYWECHDWLKQNGPALMKRMT